MKIKLSILFLCLTMSIFSQEKVDISFIDAPLLNVLKETEAFFKVKFSFSTEVINDKNISFKKRNVNLFILSMKFNVKHH
nr:hypothetical protein BACY1_26510 [Tenacibaculum mesophilum]